MLSVYQTLSVRYMSRHWLRALLIVASIALGVGTLVATRALNNTMTTASLARVNPMPDVADFQVTNGQVPIASSLADDLKRIPGVQDAFPRIFDNVRIPALDHRSVLLIGIDLRRKDDDRQSLITLTQDQDLLDLLKKAQDSLDAHFKDNPKSSQELRFLVRLNVLPEKIAKLITAYLDRLESGQATDEAVLSLVESFLTPVMVGEELRKNLEQGEGKDKVLARALDDFLDLKKEWRDTILDWTARWRKLSVPFSQFLNEAETVLSHRVLVQKTSKGPTFNLLRVGTVQGKGQAAALGGNVLIVDIAEAARIVGPPLDKGKVNRIDVILKPGASAKKVRVALESAAEGYGQVRTPAEQDQAMGSALQGMQTGFALCGLAALVVGLFLVYNALSVCVAERRHEIGVLLSLGATQRQVRLLFAGEAAFLGLAGSLLGIPLGIGLAYLGLQPVQEILKEVFVSAETNRVDVSWNLMLLAVLCGLTTAVAAGLAPAVAASRENPASAVRQVSKAPTWGNLTWQVFCSLLLIGTGLAFILFRQQLSRLQQYWSGAEQASLTNPLGTYGGMVLVLLGLLLAAPLLAAFMARMIQPLARRWFPVTWRLAADNLVLSPGRTGLVIAALSAGVALVTQTYGTIVSNRTALRDWVREAIASDLIVSLGSPIGAGGGQSEIMKESMGQEIGKIAGVEAVLPMRLTKIPYHNTQVLLFALDAGGSYRTEEKRLLKTHNAELYKTLSETPNTVIVSDNFSALHGVHKGEFISLNTPAKGLVKFMVIGTMLDYSWNHGTIFIDRARYKELWKDADVDVFDVYVERGPGLADEQFDERVKEVQNSLLVKLGETGLIVQTRQEMQDRIEDLINRLYGIALSQQFVVMIVAALGVVTALLISVLQRRREMGLLRAIGASRNQVVRSVLAEACLMGIIGTIIGLAVGIPLQWYVLQVLILEESGYLFPVVIPWVQALVIAAAAMGIATLAGLGPALHSVRMRIPEAIAYE